MHWPQEWWRLRGLRRTIRDYEKAGVAGVHIEDQSWPKRCGHLAGKRVIPTAEMVAKIKAACDARRNLGVRLD